MSDTKKETKFDHVYKKVIEFFDENYKLTRSHNIDRLDEEHSPVMFLIVCCNHVLQKMKGATPQELDDIITNYINEFSKYMEEELPNININYVKIH